MKNVTCFFFKIIVNMVFMASILLGDLNPVKIPDMIMATMIISVNAPVFVYAVQSDIFRLSGMTYTVFVIVTLFLELIILVVFYYMNPITMLRPHLAIALILDFLILFFRGSIKVRTEAPSFEIGKAKVPVISSSRLVLRKGESVRVLGVVGNRFLIRKLNGEEHYIDAGLIEEEFDDFI